MEQIFITLEMFFVLSYKDTSSIESINLCILLVIIKIRHIVPFLIIHFIIGPKIEEKVTISNGIDLLFHP